MNEEQDREVIEPEVLPPESQGRSATGSGPDAVASVRWVRVSSALFAGLLLDLADFATPVPHGALLGALVGWYICRTQAIPQSQRVWWIAASALYCGVPMTGFYPLATLVLLYRALRK